MTGLLNSVDSERLRGNLEVWLNAFCVLKWPKTSMVCGVFEWECAHRCWHLNSLSPVIGPVCGCGRVMALLEEYVTGDRLWQFWYSLHFVFSLCVSYLWSCLWNSSCQLPVSFQTVAVLPGSDSIGHIALEMQPLKNLPCIIWFSQSV